MLALDEASMRHLSGRRADRSPGRGAGKDFLEEGSSDDHIQGCTDQSRDVDPRPYFPKGFAHATWQRLAPFFHLPGLIVQGPTTVSVELRPFHDRQFNRDLVRLCERVNTAAPQLPDGPFALSDLRYALIGSRYAKTSSGLTP